MKKAGLIGALIYTGISVTAAGLFLVTTLAGKYTMVERFGGAGWVFLLSTIVLMPIVIPLVKRKLDKGDN